MNATLTKDGVAGGVTLNVLGQVAIFATGAGVSVLLARHYGKVIFGQYSASLVYGTMVGTVVEGGLNRILVRDVSRHPENAGKSLGAVLRGRVMLSLITVPMAMVAAWEQRPDIWWLILLAVVARCLQGLLSSYQSLLFAFEYFRASNIVETARRFALVAAVAVIVNLDVPILWAAAATVFFTVVGTGYLVRLTNTVVKVDYSASPLGYWRDAFWFWINGMLFWINTEIALLMLSTMAGDAATGINSAAQKLAQVALIIPRGVNNSIVPKLFRSAKDGRDLYKHLNVTTLLLTAVATVAAVELWFNSDPIIRLVYSTKFEEAGPTLQIYGIFLMLNFMRTPPSWYLTTSDRLRTITVFFMIGAVVIVVGNLILIPQMGGIAAAYVCAISEAVMFVLATAVTVRHTGARILIAYALGMLPGALAFAVHSALPRHLPWFVSTFVVSALFIPAMYVVVKKLKASWNPFGIFGPGSPERKVA